MTDLSIVVPAYNEAARICPTLRDIASFAASYDGTVEVIVVDDGSSDATAEVARRSGCDGLTVIRTSVNMGKGHAVRTGMLAATGELRLFTDADGSTHIDELRTLEDAMDRQGGSGICFASIAVPGAEVEVAQRGLRPAAGRIGNRIIQALALPGVHDSQRGFKLFSGDVADDLFSLGRVDGWAFDVEILAMARSRGIPMTEVPVAWKHKDDSRVTAMSYLTTLADVIGVRWRLATGAYAPAVLPVLEGSS